MFYQIRTALNEIYNRWQLNIGNVQFEKTLISGRITIINSGGKIEIGNGCMFNSGKGHNPIGGDTVCRLVSYGGIIKLGNRVGISNSTIVSRESVIIEDDVFIGGSCKIYDNDFHSINMEKRVYLSNEIPCKPVHIKRGAFIGAHTIILKGVTIGVGSVVGAGSIVTRDIPDGETWAGNPIQFVKSIEHYQEKE